MTGDRRDHRNGAPGLGEHRDRRPAKIMKVKALDTCRCCRSFPSAAPIFSTSLRRPWFRRTKNLKIGNVTMSVKAFGKRQ
jgi:hypothetical protein